METERIWGAIDMKVVKRVCLVMCVALLLVGCGNTHKEEQNKTQAKKLVLETKDKEKDKKEEQKALEEEQERQEEEANAIRQEEEAKRALTIVIDPGHSAVIAQGSEPVGPGSSEYKAADAGGTRGVASGVPEYELTLLISQQLRTELENRGYTVLLTRESNDVPVSCTQRAEVANSAKASAFVRIHANGSENQGVQGAMTICTTPQSPYVPQLYTSSRQLSDCIINKLCESTGCVSEGVWETDSMSGNNWSQVPVTIVEMGYMTNPQEDMLMQTAEYQAKIVQGIANGIDAFLGYQ